jgi:hypothetical protein
MIRKIAIPAVLLTLALAAPPASATTGPGPVGEWLLNGGSGLVAPDSSGLVPADNGTITPDVSWTSGPTGSALSFDGTTGQVRVRDTDGQRLDPPWQVTVAAWVAASGSPGGYKYILAKGGQGCAAASYGLYSGPNGGLEFYISRAHGTTFARSPDEGPNVWDGRWHLAVGTFDNTTIRLYVDGAQVGSGTQYPGPIEYGLSDANDLFIGTYPSCSGKVFNGTISDVRVWNRALSAAEVSGLTTPTQPPPIGVGNPPSTAPQAPVTGGSGSGSVGSGGGSVGTWTKAGQGTGTPQSTPPPVIGMVSLSSSILTVGSGTTGGKLTPLIAYNDSGSSRVTFTILQVQSKAMQTRCIKFARQRHRSPIGYCPRLVSLGRFVHQDHRGHNTVRFPRALTPAPGNYVLDVTPSLGGTVGKTLSIAFKVIARR